MLRASVKYDVAFGDETICRIRAAPRGSASTLNSWRQKLATTSAASQNHMGTRDVVRSALQITAAISRKGASNARPIWMGERSCQGHSHLVKLKKPLRG